MKSHLPILFHKKFDGRYWTNVDIIASELGPLYDAIQVLSRFKPPIQTSTCGLQVEYSHKWWKGGRLAIKKLTIAVNQKTIRVTICCFYCKDDADNDYTDLRLEATSQEDYEEIVTMAELIL